MYPRLLPMVVVLAILSPATTQQPQRREGALKVGDVAPDFSIKDVEGKSTTKLSELKGKPVVLIFGSCT